MNDQRAPLRPARQISRPVLRQYELVERVKSYDPDADEELLNRAYVYAMQKHGQQKRANGDPYFHHPVEVAGILASLKLDDSSIATGLLHDTVEDTDATIEDIEKIFGPVVSRLVNGVTKLGKIEAQPADVAQAENFRKLLLAMSEDIRVLLVKLGDRLHNMRTLHFIKKPEKRRRIARETMEIYAPLSARIGMDTIKAELEDLAFKELHPDAHESITQRLEQLRQNETDLIGTIARDLRKTLHSEGLEVEVSGREKSPLSIWRKMQRKNISFEALVDITAFRIVTQTKNECYTALGIIHHHYNCVSGRFKDFISTVKPNGYRSIHTTVVGPQNRVIEIQIRSKEMHQIAEYGVAAHWAYKENRHVTDGTRYQWIRELLEILEHTSDAKDFYENTKLAMFQDQVFCFTPRGDLIPLPVGATPIDFAYAVHSEVGDHCKHAKVNGRLVPFRTVLENGNQVEIITSKSASPTAAWERLAVSGKAKARIRKHLRSKERQHYLEKGRRLLTAQAARYEYAVTEADIGAAAEALKIKSASDLLVGLAEGHIAMRQVISNILPKLDFADNGQDTELPLLNEVTQLKEKHENSQKLTEQHSHILGLEPGVAYHMAGCCHPVFGDPIIGIVRTGKGVSIHRKDCANLKRNNPEEQQVIDLAWPKTNGESTYISRLSVSVHHQPGALGEVTTAIGKESGNIRDVWVGRREGDVYEMLLDVEVHDIDHLGRVSANLRTNPNVVAVERDQS